MVLVEDRLLEGFMSIDIKKAFNSIDWTMIDDTLEAIGFSSDLHHIPRKYYSAPSFSVLVDGEPSKIFRSQRGLRQGNLILPLLFNLTIGQHSRDKGCS